MIYLVENPEGNTLVAVPEQKRIDCPPSKIYQLFCPDCNPHCLNKIPTVGAKECYICGEALKPRYPIK